MGSLVPDAGPVTGQPCEVPAVQTCAEGVATVCRSDHTLEVAECDPMQGSTCNPDGCVGPCAPFAMRPSYQGCDYYPTVTMNPVWSMFTFAVSVSATSASETTSVTITRGDAVVTSTTLAPGEVRVIGLPWVPELKGPDFLAPGTNTPEEGPTRLVRDGAYRLRTDHPIVAYQLSALEYTLGAISDTCPGVGHPGGCNSYSNDASLLLPANALGTDYTIVAWPSGGAAPSIAAITATADATQVYVEEGASIRPGDGIDASGGLVVLDRGDVLELVAEPGIPAMGFGGSPTYGGDLTAVRVRATAPVQVVGGNGCANVPEAGTGFCDHVEELVLPTSTLGTEYVVGALEPPPDATSRAYVLRVVRPATDAGLDPTVHFEPSIHADVTLTASAPILEVTTTEADVHVTADHPISVAQYMQGSASLDSSAGPEAPGDPSQSQAVPVRQFRSDYDFFASSTYDVGWVMLLAHAGASITVDGSAVPSSRFRPAGGDWVVASVPLDATSEVHHAASDQPFGIVVYGYGIATSYLYPGGLDLDAQVF